MIERGEEWSHVISNGVEGYIKSEYLAFGSEARDLAEVYGTAGVKTNWDDVQIFSAPNAAAKILETASAGQSYEVISDNGDWIAIQLDDSSMAYVPAEDVEETILLERAIPVSTEEQTAGTQSTETQTEASQEETTSTYGQTEMTDDAQQTQTEYEEPSYEEAYGQVQTEESDIAETAQTEAYTEQAETETPSTEAAAEEPSEETVTTASADDVSLLASLIYCEAGNQSREGKVAVGAVVLHRVASGSFANTIRGVIYQSGQFTPAYSGALDSALANGVPSDCYEAAQAALNGEDPVPGALYFNTGSGRGVKIGDHQFY